MQRGALPDLNTFLLVAEHLSFRAAAERLELTAPAVSHSIRQLEARLGVRLLNRTTRSVSLTHAGLRLLDRVRPAFNQISGALGELNEERRLSARPRISPGGGHHACWTTSLRTTAFNIDWEQRAHLRNGILSGMEKRAKLLSQAG
jgi:DNA-binding transcriptional LysR family regulator